MNDAAVARIDAYVRAYEDDEHTDDLLSDEALAEAERLRGSPATEALRARAWFFWSRYRAAGEFTDLAAAVEACDLLQESDPGVRPPQLAQALDHLTALAAGQNPALPDGDTAPADEEAAPTDGDAVPADGEAAPADGEPVLPERAPLDWATLFLSLGGALGDAAGDDVAGLDRAILAMGTGLALLDDADGARLWASVLYGRFVSLRGQAIGDVDDLRTATDWLRYAIDLATPGDALRSLSHVFLCGTLAHLYVTFGQEQEAAAFAEAAVTALGEIPQDHQDWAAIADLTRGIAQDDVTRRPHWADETGILLAQAAVAATPAADSGRPVFLVILGQRLSARAGQRRSADDNAQAVAAMREAVALSGSGEPAGIFARTVLSICLVQRFELVGDAAYLPEALTMARAATEAGPPPELRLHCLLNLATALSLSYSTLGRRDRLEELIDLLDPAELETPAGARGLYLLGAAHYERHELDGSRDDLERSVTIGRRAVALTPDGDPGLADALGNLGSALRLRHRLTSAPADLEEALRLCRRAVDVTPADHAERPGTCLNLGATLRERYRLTGSRADLEEAVAWLRESMRSALPGSPVLALARTSLGATLADHHTLSGVRAELDEAVTLLRAAAETVHVDSLNRPSVLNLLATVLHQRFGLTGSGRDLDESVSLYRAVLAATLPTSPMHLTAGGNLGNVLESWYVRDGDVTHLDDALAVLERAEQAAGPGSEIRPVILTNLAKVLAARHGALGEPDDLTRAVAAARAAYDALPPASVLRARYRANWGSLLVSKAVRSGAADELDQAIEVLRGADAEMAPADPTRALLLGSRADALLTRHRRTGSSGYRDEARGDGDHDETRGDHDDAPGDLEEAIGVLRTAVGLTTSPAHARVRAARMWAQAADEAGDTASALEALEAAVRLTPLLAWRGIPRADQESRLGELSWLAADAAALAVGAGRPELAVELLEHGRGVLWAQLLEVRGDLSELRPTHPELADRLQELRAALERESDGEVREDRSLLAGEWDDLVARVRTLDGFEHFLRPPAFTELVTAAAAGPVVLINVSARRCDALLLTGDGGDGDGGGHGRVTVCPLPDLHAQDVVNWAGALLELFERPPATLLENVAAQQRSNELLHWLGRTVTTPVLTAIGDAPRVWWCPTGPLALLPLHAGTDPATGECVLDRVVSSYTPTLRALIHARARPAGPAGPKRSLLVAMEHTPGAPDLTVQPEIDAMKGLLGDRCKVIENATVADVRDRLDGHPWVHFACHGTQDPEQPSHSGVALRDGTLTVLDIAGLRLPDAELAFLSACRTASIGAALTDEAIHLAAALHTTGFRHVVATLWPVYDVVAPEVTRLFYEGLAAARDPAESLHRAVRRLRDDGNSALPGVWAPYVHLGP